MTDRKKPGVAFWATVVLVALVGYPLSMGPAWWLWHKLDLPAWVTVGMDWVYEPVWWASWNGPDWFCDAAKKYLNWWTSGA